MQAWMNMVGLGVVASALALAAPAAAQQGPPAAWQRDPAAADAYASACTLTITPSVLRAGATPFRVTALPSQGIGVVGSAGLQPAGSGIDVWIAQTPTTARSTRRGAAAPGPSADAQAAPPPPLEPFHLTLNTAGARPGDWTLAVSGEEGTCTGTMHVDGAAANK